MTIAKDDVAIIEYTVTANGEQLDTSEGKEPLAVIVGLGQLVPGLEQALLGKKVGDKFDADIAAEDAYGERNDNLVQAVPKSMFGDVEVEVGMQFRATTDEGEQSVIIIGMEEDEVIVDGNHPLSGIDLAFTIEVIETRKATEEELAHGHVHAEGGCGHHH
ncbi:FKBP-type peptidyl-prolyl cis-trans isomerase [Agarivorans sp. MS3-6]|uniref:FKBP-type peptidyl-prolyl cis-trans isomerase n=1 Tax=Agarivorans sp. TSD2052 TaxID=2937286 RepID=UPI00200CC918|nr:peptidylprolyl isomerase [Agarivorans sp. TSD2052]UPW16743.1 peptidylprolyl isomerase [Agarivorans sp. TSD2052]